LQGSLYVNLDGGAERRKIYEEEFGARRNPAINQTGAFFGEATRSATQPYLSLNASKNVNKKLFIRIRRLDFQRLRFRFRRGKQFSRAAARLSPLI
jgi:hypothetical protein